ncbi:PEP/pyruvate-binding domain-containing protein [Maridesulfovibrio ferrireducens]|uniref:PEP/pyruvate-binding domain-containing protein n=1 Tax=Maridesulfovibrio ferrireducens TaxID=246191 RepID=UPI001A1ED072|nr:PEP/pyruvate-binding domain-containing protein [Maridesulfovibrio ferrireducens]MBI9113161.1 hypothetical protein [Maridesulfovibrio ferrireducens]
MNLEFETKAETLSLLQNAGFKVQNLFYFSVRQWFSSQSHIIDRVQRTFKNHDAVIVRSSSQAEDSESSSCAGAFESILNVDFKDESKLKIAIESVIASYTGESGDQVLVQPMVHDIALSGVIMIRCLEDGSPYYVINYDDESGKTDSITGGTGVSKTIYIYNGVAREDFDSQRVCKIMKMVQQLEDCFHSVPLDIEFCQTRDQKVHLLQVRRIATHSRWDPNVEKIVSSKISFVKEFGVNLENSWVIDRCPLKS